MQVSHSVREANVDVKVRNGQDAVERRGNRNSLGMQEICTKSSFHKEKQASGHVLYIGHGYAPEVTTFLPNCSRVCPAR